MKAFLFYCGLGMVFLAGTMQSCDKQKLHTDMEKLPQKFYRGTVMSYASYLEEVGGIAYRENNVSVDPYRTIAAHGGNMVRLHLEPETYERIPQMDVEQAPEIDWMLWSRIKHDMVRARDAGLEIAVTLKLEKHIPRCWEHITDREELGQTFYDWCMEMLEGMAAQNTFPALVTIVNEVNASFMAPKADIDNGIYDYSRNAYFLNLGAKAVKTFSAKYGRKILTGFHIWSPSNTSWWMNNMKEHGLEPFDVLCISWYYKFDGHTMGGWRDFRHLGQWIRNVYNTDFMILETSCPWTLANGDAKNNRYGYIEDGYSYSPSEQRRWLRTLAEKVREGGGLGVITWGTEFVATNVWMYADADWGKGSSWDNNAYWDFNYNVHEGIDWMGDVK